MNRKCFYLAPLLVALAFSTPAHAQQQQIDPAMSGLAHKGMPLWMFIRANIILMYSNKWQEEDLKRQICLPVRHLIDVDFSDIPHDLCLSTIGEIKLIHPLEDNDMHVEVPLYFAAPQVSDEEKANADYVCSIEGAVSSFLLPQKMFVMRFKMDKPEDAGWCYRDFELVEIPLTMPDFLNPPESAPESPPESP